MNRYTNFILTVIAVAMIGILFKGEIIKRAYAGSEPLEIWHYVNKGCVPSGGVIICNYTIYNERTQ